MDATLALVKALRALVNGLLIDGRVELADAIAKHLAEGDAKSAFALVAEAFPAVRA